MDFLKNGTEVDIMDSGVKGKIIRVCIRGIEPNISIEYEVQWMCSATLQNQWMFGFQVKEHIETKQKAGMVNYETLPEKL